MMQTWWQCLLPLDLEIKIHACVMFSYISQKISINFFINISDYGHFLDSVLYLYIQAHFMPCILIYKPYSFPLSILFSIYSVKIILM